jgi:hypothetical protein
MITESSIVVSIKYYLGVLSGYMLLLGAMIEPSVGVWVVSIAGALLTATLGADRNVARFLAHILIGLCWGIFGSQIVHSYMNIGQVPASFVTGLFGVELTWFGIRTLRTASLVEMIEAIRGIRRG